MQTAFQCEFMAMKVAKRHLKDTAKMDEANRATSYALKQNGSKLKDIQKMVP